MSEVTDLDHEDTVSAGAIPAHALPDSCKKVALSKDYTYFCACVPPNITYYDTHGSRVVRHDVDSNVAQELQNSSLTHLLLWENFQMDGFTLPRSITHLTFNDSFNESLPDLPATLTHLTFGYLFNKLVNDLPTGLTHLTFPTPSEFNKQVDKLPPSLVQLKFGVEFNQAVDMLPPALKELKLGDTFNRTVDQLPKNLTHLSLGFSFVQAIDNLPKTIISLILLNNRYTKPITTLPPNLKNFELGTHEEFDDEAITFADHPNILRAKLPDSLISLTGNFFNATNLTSLPHKLQKLTFLNGFNLSLPALPSSLRVLRFSRDFNLPVVDLPPNLEELYFGSAFNKPLSNLPNNLLVLSLGNKFSSEIVSLPPHLTTLNMPRTIADTSPDPPLPAIPPGLTTLVYGSPNDTDFPLPPSLTTLLLNDPFMDPLPLLPPLTTLELGFLFIHPLLELPDSLLNLTIKVTLSRTTRLWKHPPNLRTFKCKIYGSPRQNEPFGIYEEKYYPLNKVKKTTYSLLGYPDE